jgi:hypothetical protein
MPAALLAPPGHVVGLRCRLADLGRYEEAVAKTG